MPLKLGSTTVNSFRLGSTAVSKVYAGSSTVWTSATAPGVPTSLSGTAGNTQVVLTWTAPGSDGGSAITDYVVQYSSDSGSTWTTFSDGTSSSTGATVTGLTNGTAYVFRVAAVNAVGTGSYSTASDAVTPTVPCTESVLLLHFDGDDEDTSTTDSSASNHSITFNGDAMISTSQSKFGGSSLLVDGTGDCTVAPDGDWFNFGSGDFTIEAWVYPLSTSGAHAVASIRSSSETDLAFALYVLDGSSYLVLSSSGTSWAVNAGGSETIAADEWSHMALVRYGSSVKVYVNGALSQSHTFSDSVFNSSEPLRVGSGVLSSPNQDFYGYIDDFRVVKGLAVYQAEFAPPSSQLSACVSVAPASAPGVPTGVSGTAGDTQVSLTWTEPASDGGSAITDYVVQYSSDSGSNWNTFSDGTSTATSATVTGLTNDTAYTFRVAAVNAVGAGSYSSASAAVTPAEGSPLLADLVAFYKLSDNTDSSGNGYTLTETNVTYDTGKIGNSAVFDGTAYLSTSSLPSLSSEMTLTLWFKITGADSEDFLIGCGSSDGAFYLVRASGDVKAAVSGTGEVLAGGSGAADGSWHFAAVVRTATTLKVWLDATSGSGSGAYSSINSPSPFKIGSNFDGTYLLMNGNIDAVGLWSRALSDSEIAEMYASGSGLELP